MLCCAQICRIVMLEIAEVLYRPSPHFNFIISQICTPHEILYDEFFLREENKLEVIGLSELN